MFDRMLEGGHSLIINLNVSNIIKYQNQVLVTHCVPLGILSLLLKLGELAPVVDGGEEFPDEEQSEAHRHDRPDHGQRDGHGVHRLRTLCRGGGGKRG